mmetsp:Transcript_15308/g.21320  ORF Transcript_15308/g.21320 Transcript_15308/m.21320 type:complete len:485 (+) Transcript_15308:64-1518(+)
MRYFHNFFHILLTVSPLVSSERRLHVKPKRETSSSISRELDLDDLGLEFEQADFITVDLHDGVIFDEFEYIGTRRGSGFHGENTKGDLLNLVRRGNKVFGSLVEISTNNTFLIKDINGTSVVEQHNAFEYQPEGYPDESDVPAMGEAIHDTVYQDQEGNNVEIDIMVVWTRDAECGQSNLPTGCGLDSDTEENMRGLIDLAIEETNVAYDLSGVHVELKLVHAERRTDYNESYHGIASSHALSALLIKDDGVMDDIHQKRDHYGADMVAMLINGNKYCGMAHQGPKEELAFAVVNYKCATGQFSFAHELAHNMGAQHDRGSLFACKVPNRYNYAYCDPDAAFRSIMAYPCTAGQCDNNVGGGCRRVQRFSNSAGNYNGNRIGSVNSDNARQINNAAHIISAFRESAINLPQRAPPSSCKNFGQTCAGESGDDSSNPCCSGLHCDRGGRCMRSVKQKIWKNYDLLPWDDGTRRRLRKVKGSSGFP